MKRVLIIDDDAENLDIVSEMLKGSFEPLRADSGKEGLAVAVRGNPDIILLDVNMPDMDGYEVCKRLRENPQTRAIPIVMLTTSVALESRVKGLDSGADDYITKPFQGRELIARLNARIRRVEFEAKKEEELSLGNLKLNPKSFQVWVADEEIRLTQMEFELLRYFLEHPNQVIQRNKLLGDLWPDSVVTDRTVDTHIANLRKKIKNFTYSLTTVYGAGYILKTSA